MAVSSTYTPAKNEDSADKTKQFFDRFYDKPVNYNANEVDAVIAYFLKRGFGEVAAINTSVVLLQQAKQDKINVYKLIDTLKGINDIQLSNIVTQILNDNRNKTSTLGFRVQDRGTLLERRNVIIPNAPEEEIIQDPPISDYIQPGYVQRGYVE
jgi:hypothetical protein